MSIPLDFSDLDVEGGTRCFETISFSGKRKVAYFCDQCGTRLWHSGTAPPSAITLKAGTLDNAQTVRPVAHLWVSKKNAGIELDPRAELFETQPDDVQLWRSQLKPFPAP